MEPIAIFVSYSSKDRAIVQLLVGDLVQLGHKVWFDQELTGGQLWWNEIISQIQTCELFVFALSPNSLASGACEYEYVYATGIDKRVLPVVIMDGDYSNLPYLLRIINYVDYRQRNSDSLLKLMKALANLPLAKPLPAVMPPVPPVPIPPLVAIRMWLESPSLSFDKQIEILNQLKYLLNQPTSSTEARTLLLHLQNRTDAYARIASEISMVLSNSLQQGVESQSSIARKEKDADPEIERQIRNALADLKNGLLSHNWGFGVVSCFSLYGDIHGYISFKTKVPDDWLAVFVHMGWSLKSTTVEKRWPNNVESKHFYDEMTELHRRLGMELNRFNIRRI